jgi:hypothetical protein
VRRGAALALLVLLSAGLARAADEPPARFAGMTLAAALEKLQKDGLQLLYSSDLVHADMLVRSEPAGRWPNEILDQLLAPHGLRAEPGPSGALLVVPAPRSGWIEGTVRLAPTRDPLAGVRVVLGGSGVEATTDARGRFRLGPLPEGTYRLDTARDGFLSRKLDGIRVKTSKVTRVEVALDPRWAASEEVVVRASGALGAPQAKETIAPASREDVPGIAHDALSAAAQLPGVATTDGQAGWSVRGGASREAKIVLDGLELYAPYHLKEIGGPIGIVDSRDVGGMGFLSGAFPAEYGGQMSAVVEMRTLDPAPEDANAIAWSTEDARLASRGSAGDRFGWLVSARRGDPSRLLDALGADPAYRPTYWDLLARADWKLGSSTISFHVLGGTDSVTGDEETDPVHTLDEPGTFLSHNDSRYTWVSASTPLGPRLFVESVVSAGSISDERNGSDPLLLDVQDRRTTYALGVKQDWLFQAKRHGLKWGFELKGLRTGYEYERTPVAGEPLVLSPAPSGQDVGAYVADRIDLSPEVRVEMGLRWDRQSWLDAGGTVSPRVNAVWSPNERTAMKLGWGIFYQPQRTDELQVEDGVATFYAPERAEHRVLSLEHERPDGLRFRASLYSKRMTDLHPRYENLFDPFGLFPEAAADRVEIDASEGRADGLELAVAGPAGARIAWWGSYALSRAEDLVGSTWVPRSWDQTHAVSAGVRFRIADVWSLSFTDTFHSGRPTTPVSATATALPDGSFEIVPQLGARNSERLPSYLRVDARLGRTFRIGSTRLTASLTVSNLLDRSNPCCVEAFEYAPHPDGTVTVTPKLREGLPRLVVAGVEWTF